MAFLSSVYNVALLVIGFGFVIFWHELGHFLAAKWVKIRVEQFAVGMGHAIFSYRKGLGWRWGSTLKEYERRAVEYLDKECADQISLKDKAKNEYTERDIFRAADALGLGQTEYRVAWFPIGGYVKPYGQDDLDMSSRKDDSSSYSSKTVGQRMFVISAGVIMNVILAGILFMVLFLHGFRAPAPIVGRVAPLSPFQLAGGQVGDELLTYDGKTMHDFTKFQLEQALSSAYEDVKIVVRRAGTGEEKELTLRPQRGTPDPKSFIEIGVRPTSTLVAGELVKPTDPNLQIPASMLAIELGDTIVAVNQKPLAAGEYYLLDRAIQQSTLENPAEITVRNSAGQTRQVKVEPHFDEPFAFQALEFAGMEPRLKITLVGSANSPLYGKLKSGDVIQQIVVNSGPGKSEIISGVTLKAFRELMKKVGEAGSTLDITALRDGKTIATTGIKPIRLERGVWGLNIAPAYDQESPVVARVVKDSPAALAGIAPGSTIKSIDAKPVKNWFDIRSLLLAGKSPVREIEFIDPDGKEQKTKLAVDATCAATLGNMRLAHDLPLQTLSRVRKTSSPLTALNWGVTETRDLILQFYVTLRRMATGEVSPSNLMGPVGIFGAGAQFASRGTDWLIWFLAMISANLAVVNFLPIPIVDGGHFVFLLIEKITGKPPSRRVLETAQLLGLVFILGVFLFVTWNDILRIAGRQ